VARILTEHVRPLVPRINKARARTLESVDLSGYFLSISLGPGISEINVFGALFV
jgi:hypothetical protein